MPAPAPVHHFSGVPALPPPDGVIPQLRDPPNRNTEALIGIVICLVLAGLSAITRAAFVICTRKRPHAGDFLSLASIALFFTYMGILFGFFEAGFYVHQWNIPIEVLPEILYHDHVSSVIYEATMASIKIAILLDWLRIFVSPGTRGWFWWTAWALLILISMYYAAAILIMVFSCIPHEKIWHAHVPGHCSDVSIIFITSASINALSDVIMLILPQQKIWGLHLTWKKKLNVSLAFSIGLLACACAGARLAAGVQRYQSLDETYCIAQIALWCMTEMTCGYLIFCMPGAPKVYGREGWLGKRLATGGGSRTEDSLPLKSTPISDNSRRTGGASGRTHRTMKTSETTEVHGFDFGVGH